MKQNKQKKVLHEVGYWAASIAAGALLCFLCSVAFDAAVAKKEAAVVKAPEPQSENGVVTAAEWASVYPEIVASYEANSNNTYRISYLAEDQDPYLIDIYEGYGFAKDYTSAVGHTYCLEDVYNTERPHALANCLTCKTADFTKLVNDTGVSAYSLDFEEVYASMSENVGCYTCHANETEGTIVITHDYMLDVTGVSDSVLSCGQCHIEYYFHSDTKETDAPYTDVAGMSPDAILAYYDELGFSDWTQPSTGTGLLKAQHPEMETFLGTGSRHASLGLTCASCHMEKVTDSDGTTYTSHELVSPLSSPAILATCAECHGTTDMAEKVHAIQEQVTARETEVGNTLADFKNKLADAVASGTYSDEELDEIRLVYRHAQWYFDFDYVENSEGAHNSTLAFDCLDKAADLIDQGMAMFHDAPEAPVSVSLENAPDGTYTASGRGFGGDISVEVTLAGGKIVDVKITGDNETPGLGAVAVEEMPAQFLNAQAVDVDGVSGATISSTAIRKAFSDALEQAGVDTALLVNESADIPAKSTVEPACAWKDGTYTASQQGFGGEITVELTIAGGIITDVKITGDSETPGLGGRAVEEMPAQFLNAQSAEVDGVSGATISSTAIRAAFADALAKAG